MNIIQSSLAYAGGVLYFNGRAVVGFDGLIVRHGAVKVLLKTGESDIEQVKAMKAAGIHVRHARSKKQ